MTIYDKIREPEATDGIQPSSVAPRRTIYDAIRGADAKAALLPAATAPAGPAPAQAVASAPVISSAPASPVASAPLPQAQPSQPALQAPAPQAAPLAQPAPSAEPAPAAPPAAPRFGQPGYNPLLHGAASRAPIGGVPAHLDRPAPTAAEVRARQAAPAAQAQAPVNPVLEPGAVTPIDDRSLLQRMVRPPTDNEIMYGSRDEQHARIRKELGLPPLTQESETRVSAVIDAVPGEEKEEASFGDAMVRGADSAVRSMRIAPSKVSETLSAAGRGVLEFLLTPSAATGDFEAMMDAAAKASGVDPESTFSRQLKNELGKQTWVEERYQQKLEKLLVDEFERNGVAGKNGVLIAHGIVGLATRLAMIKAATGLLPGQTGGASGSTWVESWANSAVKTASHASRTALFTYATQPGSHEERKERAITTYFYMMTPTWSVGIPSNFIAPIADIASNFLISNQLGLYDGAIEQAKAEHGDEWKSNLWRHLTSEMIIDAATNVAFGMKTRSATAQFLNDKVGPYINEVARELKKHGSTEPLIIDLQTKMDAALKQAETARASGDRNAIDVALETYQFLRSAHESLVSGTTRQAAPVSSPEARMDYSGIRPEQEELDTTRAAAAEALGTPRIGAEAQMEAERGAVPVSGDAWRQTVGVEAPSSAARVNPLLEPERVAQPAVQAERPAEPQAEAARPAEKVAATEASRPPIEQARDEAGVPDVAPREATSRLDESKHPTVELPIESLKLSADVPNFKEGASETGEVEPLQGRYERLGTPPVVVWERTNGDREIITGRHRWNLAKRSGEKTIPAQVVREADGFTKDDAAIFDAEANIRDGQGSVKDYANFFKKRGISREEASSSGLLSREKGRDGYEIGTSASDDLYALFAAGKISPRKAAAIAKQAPGQPEAQKLGMDYAEKHNAEQTEQYMRAVVSMAPKSSDKQLDLLGWDDSWQIQADKMGRAASDIRGELSAERTSLKHALSLTGKRQAEVVKKYGFKTGDKDAIKARVGELERELISWENWNLDAELTATVRERAGLPPAEKPAPADSFKLESASKAEIDAEAKRIADKAKLDDMATAPMEGRPDADIGQARLPGTGGEIDLFNAPKKTAEAASREAKAQDAAKPPEVQDDAISRIQNSDVRTPLTMGEVLTDVGRNRFPAAIGWPVVFNEAHPHRATTKVISESEAARLGIPRQYVLIGPNADAESIRHEAQHIERLSRGRTMDSGAEQSAYKKDIQAKRPIPASAVEQNKIALPDGYTLEGDRYVFKGEAQGEKPAQGTAPRTAADLAKPAQEPARVAEPSQEPSQEKPATPLAKAIAEVPQAFRVTSSRGNVHNVKMPDGVTYPIRAESKAEAIAKAQELASRTPEDVIDDSIRMVEEAKSQAEKDAKGGYVSTGAATPVERVLRRAMEGFFGHMRAFGEQYVSDRPLMRRLEQAYHERAAAVESGIADIGKILAEAGPRRLEDGVAVAIAIEEGVARDTLPPSARRLYDLSKQTMDAITDLEKAEGVLKKGFPEGTRDAINEKIAEIQAKRKMNKADMEEVSKLQEELAVLDKFAAYLPHGIVARRVMQKIFEEGNGRARRDLGNRLEQFHHQRKGRGTMREYLEAKVIRPEDMDIGRLMMDSAVSAYQKISMKALMDYGIENKYIRFGHKAPGDPKEWFEMPQLAKPAQVFKVSPPEGQKVWVQRLFGLGLEELSGAQNKPTTAFDKLLSIVKVGQFYNPRIIWSYNLQQRIYGGAVEWNPVKDAINTKDAWRAVLTDNEDYQQANRLGIFQVPDNLPRATVDSQIDIASRSMRTDLSRGGVIGNQLVKVLERATGEKMDPQAWKDKNLRAALDAIMLPLRGISSATWMGDKVQRMHTFYNLTRRGMSPQDAAEQTARIHGAYSKIGKEYKAWARRVFFVHSFRLLMPIQTMRAYTTPIKIAMKALTGKDIPQGETRRAIMALAGTVLFPTLIDSALRYNGWTPTEEEEEFFKKGPMKYLRIPVGKDGYRVTLALPNWKYKKTFMYDGEEREVVLGVNNIANMATKWIMRAAPKDNIVSPTTKDLPIMTLLKWEISPLYRIGMDIFDNNSSFGTAPPRGSTGKDWDSAVGYLFGNIWRMYGDAYRMVSDDRESDVYKERQMAEMMEAMNLGDRVLQNVFGYAYTRAGPEKRVGSMINALRRSAGAARSTAEIHYKGETLEEKIAEIDILEAKMERALRRRYNAPRPPAEIVRIITDPGLADNPSKQANAARLVKYGMDGMTAKDLRTAFVKEAREQGWNTEMYDSKGKLTAYGRRKLQLSRFIRKNNIE